MNEELKILLNQYGIELLEKVKTGIDLSTDFLGEQLPIVAQEIINWGIGKAIFWTIVMFTITAFFITFCFYCRKKANEKMEAENGVEWDGNSAHSWGAIISFCLAILFFVITVNYGVNIVKISVAPRVYLIEQLVKMTKGTQQ